MISGLEAFDGIQLDFNKESDTIDTGITLKEKEKKTRIEVGIGYETDIGPRGILRYEKRNFKGDAKKVTFDFKYSAKEKFATNSIYLPAFLKVPISGYYYLDLKNDFTYSKIEFDNFIERKFSNFIHLLKDYDWYSIDFGMGYEKINIKKTEEMCGVSDGDFNLLFPFAKINIDLRDSRINPKNGIYVSQYFEAGLAILKDSSTYTKSITEARIIKSLGLFTFAAKGKLGLIEEYENYLPESKLFFAGGAFSNRGYGYNTLGAVDAECTNVGGKTLIDTTLEINHPLYKKIDGALFLDSTLLSAKSHRFSIDFVHSIGTGIRYISPIGPVKLDMGMDIENRSQYAIHFQIGQSF
jgi:translocation and assembly module TamA